MAYLDTAKKASIAANYQHTLPHISLPGLLDEIGLAVAGHASAAVTDLSQDISATYEETEVQAISDKVDELLAAMRTAELLLT